MFGCWDLFLYWIMDFAIDFTLTLLVYISDKTPFHNGV